MLFLLYITANINSHLCLFADDCLISCLIALLARHQILKDDLDTLAATWQMKFNVNKCKILQVSTHCTESLFFYQMFGIPLNIVEQYYTTECHGNPTLILLVIKQITS